ncbi:MAG TPA: hypothetical protein VGP80_00330 [Gemmatimonadales bacterium]|nr:hypothetical protein [Gemmatimonadales bacterium]
MRTHMMKWMLAAAICFPIALSAQNVTMLSHNSPEAVARVLENQAALQLTTAQVERLNQLLAELTREQTRLVTAEWLGAPGKARVPRYERVRVASHPDRYMEITMVPKIVAFNRVPGKAVPRLAQIPVFQLIERPCPFTFLAGAQLDQAHELLTMRM